MIFECLLIYVVIFGFLWFFGFDELCAWIIGLTIVIGVIALIAWMIGYVIGLGFNVGVGGVL
jgi:hypothetical protein